jgi:hypothetical protein
LHRDQRDARQSLASAFAGGVGHAGCRDDVVAGEAESATERRADPAHAYDSHGEASRTLV